MKQMTGQLDRACPSGVRTTSVADPPGAALPASGAARSLLHDLVPCAADTDAQAQDPTPEQTWARLQQLFRLSLRSGTINPLLHLVKRYRSGSAS